MRRQSTTFDSLRRSSLISLGLENSSLSIDGDFAFPSSFTGLKADASGHGVEQGEFTGADDNHEGGIGSGYPMNLNAMSSGQSPWLSSIESGSRHSLYMPNMMGYHSMFNMPPFMNSGYDDHPGSQGFAASLDDHISSSLGSSGFPMNFGLKRDESTGPFSAGAFGSSSLRMASKPPPPMTSTLGKDGKTLLGEKGKKGKASKVSNSCVTPSSMQGRTMAPKIDPKNPKTNLKAAASSKVPSPALAAVMGGAVKPPPQKKKVMKRSRTSSSKYRGVSRCSKDGRFQARIRVGSKVIYLGRFRQEEDAARCYDQAAARYHRERAQFNFAESINMGALVPPSK